MHIVSRIAPILVALVACSSDGGHGSGSGVPAAPTGLAVAKVGGGGHLTWTDASHNEDHFMIMRKTSTSQFDDVAMVTFNIAQYHDSSVVPGTAYVYKVVAMNGDGEAASNEVMFTP